MRKKILIPIAVLLIIAGIVFFLYEPVSKEIGKAEAEKAVHRFDEIADNIGFSEERDSSPKKGKNSSTSESVSYDSEGKPTPTKDDIRRLRADSLAYNKKLVNNQGTRGTMDFTKRALNLADYNISDNIYCYISAPSIGLQLPVYLGASDSMMEYGAAHMCYTSLPTGGVDTNCVIGAHTGYIGKVYFDNLGGLHIGDSVNIRNYWKRLSYKVIGKKIVDEKTSDYMYIKNGRSLLTLVTCVENDKGGFDRLIVTCEED